MLRSGLHRLDLLHRHRDALSLAHSIGRANPPRGV
jgi:hypothetical protein